MQAAVTLLRYIWASPCSAVGLMMVVPALLSGGRAMICHGIVEVVLASWMHGALGRFGAITFGHVVLGRSEDMLVRTRRHERIHVQQYERWGLLFFIVYPVSSFLQWMKGRDPYWCNVFEIEARERCAPTGSHQTTGGVDEGITLGGKENER